ncbi:hypothetical protein SDC9_149895 [bioreactor metagenome]|uniref:Uncharacterized protein n=1 Tax=bioreactor metagenome TaxID=1076179 RepID=A0A645ENH3_9ZZZZ
MGRVEILSQFYVIISYACRNCRPVPELQLVAKIKRMIQFFEPGRIIIIILRIRPVDNHSLVRHKEVAYCGTEGDEIPTADKSGLCQVICTHSCFTQFYLDLAVVEYRRCSLCVLLIGISRLKRPVIEQFPCPDIIA